MSPVETGKTPEKDTLRMSVARPPASATWRHEHRWGTMLGDTTDLRVTRVDGGSLRVSYGSDTIEIRRELVDVLAGMIAAAAEWSDTAIPSGNSALGGAR